MDGQLDITIRKHWIGWVGILLVGSLAMGSTLWAMWWLLHNGDLDQRLFAFIAFALAIEAISTFISVYVYTLSNIHLTSAGITVDNWTSLFRDTKETTEWADVEDVTIQRPNGLADIFGYATLTVETAGDKVNLVMPYTPSPDYWRGQIAEYGDSKAGTTTAA